MVFMKVIMLSIINSFRVYSKPLNPKLETLPQNKMYFYIFSLFNKSMSLVHFYFM
jgi:hypothetical protein